jgi:hypothetical protein
MDYTLGQVNKSQAMAPRSIADWLTRVPGGNTPRESRYGYFGPQSGQISKDITTSPPANAFVASNFFVNTFGAKVWDSLNSQTRFFNLIRKVAWGPTTGYRIRSGRNNSTQPVTEVAALPDIDSPVLQTVFIQPKFIVTSLGVSALAQFLGTLEGGIGDALAVAQETAMIDHTKRLNQMLLASAQQRVVTGGGTPDTLIDASWVSVGDVFEGTTVAGTVTITTVDLATNIVGYSGNALTTDEIIYVSARAGFQSIDDIVQQEGVNINGVANADAAAYGSIGVTARSYTGATEKWAASSVFGNSGVLRHLTTGLLDQSIDETRRNGGEPDLIVTGVEQVTRLGTLLQANQHFVGEGTFQVKLGGEGTLKGYPTGFQVATYKGIPVFHDFDVATSAQLAANGDSKRGGNAYVLDTRYLEIPVLFTTQYMESRDYLQNNMLGIKAIYLTAANQRCLDFRKQSKILDLSDGVNLT